MKSTAKIKLKAGPDTELSYWRNDLFFYSSLSSVPSGESEITETRNIKSKQQSFRYFREISSVEWRRDPLTRELVSVSPKVQWSAVTSLFLLLYTCLLAPKGKAISWQGTGDSLLPEDESLWDQQPSEAEWWLPAVEDLWVHFYHKDLNALRRKKSGVGLQREELCREAASLRNTRSTTATAENFCRKGWCGSPTSSLGFVPVAQNATVQFCKASNLISVKVLLMYIPSRAHTAKIHFSKVLSGHGLYSP